MARVRPQVVAVVYTLWLLLLPLRASRPVVPRRGVVRVQGPVPAGGTLVVAVVPVAGVLRPRAGARPPWWCSMPGLRTSLWAPPWTRESQGLAFGVRVEGHGGSVTVSKKGTT